MVLGELASVGDRAVSSSAAAHIGELERVAGSPSTTDLAAKRFCAYCGARCFGYACRAHSDLPRLEGPAGAVRRAA